MNLEIWYSSSGHTKLAFFVEEDSSGVRKKKKELPKLLSTASPHISQAPSQSSLAFLQSSYIQNSLLLLDGLEYV